MADDEQYGNTVSVEDFGIRKGRITFVLPRTTRKRRPIDVVVHDLHVEIVLNGRVMMHSEDYASAAKARRAARALIDAIDSRPMRLIFWMGRMGSMKLHVVKVRRVWANQRGGPVAMAVNHDCITPLLGQPGDTWACWCGTQWKAVRAENPDGVFITWVPL